MRLIKPSVTTITYETSIDGMYKSIAESSYICYATDPNKAKLTPEEFVNKVIIPNDHGRCLEFGTVYLKIPWCHTYETTNLVSFFRNNHWSRVKFFGKAEDPSWLVTTNFRVIVENRLIDEMNMYFEYTPYHHKRYLAEFILSRGAADDFRTHVELSSIAESSRWCDYSKDRFGNELTFIEPYFDREGITEHVLDTFREDECRYLKGAELGMKPQELKRIYPLGAKTTLRLCGFKDAWNNFFYRRCDEHADPECILLAKMIKKEFESLYK